MTLLTEEEAKTRACCGPPAIAVATLLNGKVMEIAKLSGDLTVEGPMKGGCCIGSACMAWRATTKNTGTSYHPEHKKVGYCGLAGKPE